MLTLLRIYMPTIGNVNRGTNLTHHFFRSKVGVGRRFQYGGRRRSQSPCACADERLTGGDFDMCFTQTRPEIVRNTCAKIVKLDLGWPNSAQNLVTSRFFHDFMPCSTRRHSKTCEPISKWKIPHERPCPELSNDTNNMQQMVLLTQIAEAFWTQFSAKTPLLTRF